MGLSSSDSGVAAKDTSNGAAGQNHATFGNTLMGLLQNKYPIAGAVGNAVGIGGKPSASPALAPSAVPGQAPLPEINLPTQQAAIDPQMLEAGKIGSQHSDFLKDILKALAGGG